MAVDIENELRSRGDLIEDYSTLAADRRPGRVYRKDS